MIRNVVLGRLHADADRDRLAEGLAAMRKLEIDGLLEIHAGTDVGLRDGNWDYCITVDLADVAAYRRYDEQDEHNRLRREYFGPVSADIVRCQFELDRL
ncbi:MAG TPA: Dabb family protein [Frankiaceae bacterium]|nr:Dabb family protein [Frankiaceae bacterium]